MSDIFQTEYEQMQSIVAQFNAQAENAASILNQLQQSFQPLADGEFEGNAATNFFNEMNASIFPANQRLIDLLQQSATVTGQVADMIKTAEEEAAHLFNGNGAATGGGKAGAGSGGGAAKEEAGAGSSGGGTPPTPPTPLGLPSRPAPPPQPSSGDGSGAHGSDSAGISDYLNREMFYKVADAADALGMDNAARNMRHYLNNSGDPLEVSPEQMLNDLPGFRTKTEASFQNDLVGSINERIAAEYNGQPMTFQVTTPWDGYYARKSESQDWFYGVGGFSYSYGAEVTVMPGADGQPQVSVNYQMHVFDRYNWDEGKGVNIGPFRIGDAQLGRMHTAGIAQEYEVWGSTQPQHYEYTYNGTSPTATINTPDNPDTRRDSTRRDPDGTRRWGRGDGR